MEKVEQFYQQLTESVKLVFELSSRIDERVKILVEQQGEVQERIDKIMEKQEVTTSRLAILENKNGNHIKEDITDLKKNVRELEGDIKEDITDIKKNVREVENKFQLFEIKIEGIQQKTTHHDTRMNQVFDWVLKIMFTVVAGYLLYKAGWSPPITP